MATVLNPTYRTRLGYQAALLGGMCYLMSMLLIGGNTATHDLIDEHLLNDKLALLAQVMPASLYDNDPIADSQLINDSEHFKFPVEVLPARMGNEFVGAGLNITVQGWGGPLTFIMAVDASGEIMGVRVITHKETPGLADKIELDKDDWITEFDGKSLSNTSHIQWAVKKDNGEFDQFTGATITPRAVVSGVYRGLQFYQHWRQQQSTVASAEESGS